MLSHNYGCFVGNTNFESQGPFREKLLDGPADGSVEKLCPKASFYRWRSVHTQVWPNVEEKMVYICLRFIQADLQLTIIAKLSEGWELLEAGIAVAFIVVRCCNLYEQWLCYSCSEEYHVLLWYDAPSRIWIWNERKWNILLPKA